LREVIMHVTQENQQDAGTFRPSVIFVPMKRLSRFSI
jgi:hypothetical protein